MRSLAIACAVLMLSAATAAAGDLAVSKSTLSSMGLGSMTQMSDDAGLEVRGKGTFASVWGGSQASFGPQYSQTSYEAGAQWLGKDSFAAGGSLSFAGEVQVQFAADPTGFALQVQAAAGFAGGGAVAYAN